MRRRDREIQDFDEIVEVMRKCDVCRIAMQGGEYPYVIPLNFGMEVEETQVTLYFHGALEGMKYELLERNPKVCFEMDCGHTLYTDMERGNCTMCYESVIGFGVVEEVLEEEKIPDLDILMEHYPVPAGFRYNEATVSKTRVLKLRVEQMTGKRRAK
ncbi:pyridoxamine 5'-phosphate oxidase family protein [Candidatus Merdisoma sp. JLR.KK006]|uniref:pyridoxamine 5'-phosphate oxidase family protein n=1 Tax=Candidatus Merdisoma sp. JLR.KK006 TaxID=3112626 RepID=UPI002FEEB3E4